VTSRPAVLVALALGVVGTIAGCLDALAPHRAARVATVGLVPLFGSVASHDAIPADVDSIVITIHNPPAPDTSIAQRILPGQDSIVLTIDIPITGAVVDTVMIGMEAIRTGPPPEVLYRADAIPLAVRVGQPTRADSIRAVYVGPGAGTLRAITITPRSVVLHPGDSLSFAFTAIDSSGGSCCSTMPILWDSRTSGVAHVSARGVVTARSNGDAWIVATSGASAAIKDSVAIVVATGPVALISFGPSAATFTANTGQANPAAQTISVTNGGAGTLANITFAGIQYAGGQPTGWLAATLGNSSAPTTLRLTATTGTLPPGTFSAAVSLASPEASNSPSALPVTFTVSPVPAIGITPATVTVIDTLTTTDPAPRTVSVTNIGTGTLSGLAVGAVIYGAGQPAGWLTASLGATTTAPATVTLSLAKGTLPVGVYTATVPLTSPVALNSPQNLAVTFDVRPLPLIGLAQTTLSFYDTVTTSDPPPQAIAVTNVGTGTLGGLAVGTVSYGAGQPTGWLAASLDVGTAPATLTVGVTKGSLAPGVYSATVPITSPSAGNSPQSVTVTFSIGPLPPVISLAPARDSVLDTLTTPDPAPRTVAIANLGMGTLSSLAVGTISYAAGQPTSWLTATLNGTTAPTTITLTYAKGALPVGVYTATIPVTSAVAANSPQTLTAVFDVRPGPSIGLSTTSVSFSDTLQTSDPASQTVSIINRSGGTLSGLVLGAVSYGASQPTGWLAASLSTTTAPATLTVSVAKGALPAGVYTATVPVASAVASNSPKAVSVSFTIAPPPVASLPFSASAPAYLKQLVLTATGPAIATPVIDTFQVTAGAASGTLLLPVGTTTVTAEAFDSLGVRTHQGDTTITLVGGANPPLTLVLTALSGIVTWSFGSYVVTLNQADTTLSAGDSLRYTATITDHLGHVITGAVPTWASSNPSVASVDNSGLVRALVRGSVRIVASYRGAAASRGLTVQ